jgi:hypothetical protein
MASEHIDNADMSNEEAMALAAQTHVPDPDVYQVVEHLKRQNATLLARCEQAEATVAAMKKLWHEADAENKAICDALHEGEHAFDPVAKAKALVATVAATKKRADEQHHEHVDICKSYPGIHGESFSVTEALHWYESTVAACKAAGKNQPVRHHTEWHEDIGPVLWFDDVKSWEDVESLEGAYFGSPLCSDAPAEEMHWWIPFPDFSKVIEAAEAARGGEQNA